MKKMFIAATILALATSAFAGSGVVGSKHDIPATYPGAKGVLDEATAENGQNRVCGYCHTPHHASLDGANQGLPLWSKQFTAPGNYVNYKSFTLDGDLANDNLGNADVGASWLCLSCHDGSIAVDQHYNFAGDTKLSGDSYGDAAVGEGFDLTGDHPIGVDMAKAYADELAGNPASGLKDPASSNFINNAKVAGNTISEVLYEGTIVTCASCHDVHDFDTVAGPYMLYAPLDSSDICLSCHNK